MQNIVADYYLQSDILGTFIKFHFIATAFLGINTELSRMNKRQGTFVIRINSMFIIRLSLWILINKCVYLIVLKRNFFFLSRDLKPILQTYALVY